MSKVVKAMTIGPPVFAVGLTAATLALGTAQAGRRTPEAKTRDF